MADDNRNAENFALGLIVAALIWLLFRREFDRLLNAGGGRSSSGGGTGATPCCTSCAGEDTLPDNPGVSLGNESYNQFSFGSSSVTPKPRGHFFSEGGY